MEFMNEKRDSEICERLYFSDFGLCLFVGCLYNGEVSIETVSRNKQRGGQDDGK